MQSVYINKLRVLKLLFALVLVNSVSLPLHASEPPSLVALFGDSISLGFNQNLPTRELGAGRLRFGQPSIQLSRILNGSQRPSLVANLGAGGTPSGTPGTTALTGRNNGLSRISADLQQISNTYAPNRAKYVLIMYGTNDVAFSISAATTGFNIEQMIDRAIQQGFTPLVSTIPPRIGVNVVPINNRIRLAVSRKQGQGRNVYLVDTYARVLPTWASQLVDTDQLHPNDAGYLFIARNWFNERLQFLIESDAIPIAAIRLLLLDD